MILLYATKAQKAHSNSKFKLDYMQTMKIISSCYRPLNFDQQSVCLRISSFIIIWIYFPERNDIMYKCIWEGKPDKIKRYVSSQEYYMGGLKLPNLYKFNDALKTTWIRRYLTGNGNWKKSFKLSCWFSEKFLNTGSDTITEYSKSMKKCILERNISIVV